MACIVFVFCVAAAIAAPAQTFTNLFNFDGADGSYPQPSPLVQGIDGNFYGTTSGGGLYDSCMYGTCGTVFKITPAGTLTTLHNFTGGEDGSGPMPGLVLATNGLFYGVNSDGGTFDAGVAFTITAEGTLKTLLAFGSVTENANPNSALVQATNGNLYGTDVNGEAHGDGAIFEMTPAGVRTTLHNFDFADGWDPQDAPLVQATNGDLYGETPGGGTSSNGTVFRTTPGGEFTSLHSFDGTDGSGPYGGLVQATDGNLYGTTAAGGANKDGTVFKITLGGTVTTLHSFDGTDGNSPEGLVQATDGNFYGTTFGGGANGYGTLFKITPGGTLTTLHNFDGTDGAHPYGMLLQATNGTFYGTTSYCNLYGTPSGCGCPTVGCGTVFSLSVGLGPFVTFMPAARPVGSVVEILGQGFTSATGVSFNGTPATFTIESDTYLKATVPAGATTGNITVTEPSGTLTSNKTFQVTPQVFSFSPTSGPVGTSVVITGQSFTGAMYVTLACKWLMSFTVDSDTQITAIVPPEAISGTIGTIAVRTPGGKYESAATFTVTP